GSASRPPIRTSTWPRKSSPASTAWSECSIRPARGRALRSRGAAFAEKPRARARRAARGCLPCRRLRQKFHRLLPAYQGGRDRPLPLGSHGVGAAGIFRAVLGGKGDRDRSIFTTSNLPRHVLSTHCNAVAIDAAVDKRHTLAI